MHKVKDVKRLYRRLVKKGLIADKHSLVAVAELIRARLDEILIILQKLE